MAHAHDPLVHILSNILSLGGFLMLADAWHTLCAAHREHHLATTGIYARIRHPQYVAFFVIMVGFLFQCPALVTLAMFPILVWVYVRIARGEDAAKGIRVWRDVARVRMGDASVHPASRTACSGYFRTNVISSVARSSASQSRGLGRICSKPPGARDHCTTITVTIVTMTLRPREYTNSARLGAEIGEDRALRTIVTAAGIHQPT